MFVMVAIDNEERTDDNFKYREPYPVIFSLIFRAFSLAEFKTVLVKIMRKKFNQ